MRPAKDFTLLDAFPAAPSTFPDLRSLWLTSAGPDLPDGNQGDRKVVVRLPELGDPNPQLGDHKMVGYTLSHV